MIEKLEEVLLAIWRVARALIKSLRTAKSMISAR